MKKYTNNEKTDIKKQAKAIAEAFNEDLDQVITSALNAYILEKQGIILKRFLENKKKKAEVRPEQTLDNRPSTDQQN